MLKILRQMVFLILLMSTSIILASANANALDYPVNINFDQIRPVESITMTRTIPASIDPEKIDGIQIEVSEALTGADFKRTIPSGRLRLLLNGQALQLTNAPVKINLADQLYNTDAIDLALEITVKPEDRADNYSGKIVLKTWSNGAAGQEWQNCISLKVAVEVQPWVKMQCELTRLTLDQVSYTKASLTNPQALRLRIASNSNWILACNLKNPNSELHPTVKVISGQSNQIQVCSGNSGLTADRRNLAFGAATATGSNYWLDLEIAVELADIIKYAAKEYDIPLQFTVLLWERKSAIP